MALILNLETATKTCSVALAESGTVLSKEELTSEKFSHAEKLNGFIESVLKSANKTIKDVDAVAVSEGPGSYTGLRIGVSTAKGICYGLDIPLIAVNSLKCLAAQVEAPSSYICPMFDARRMEVYTAIFDENLNVIEDTNALVVEQTVFEKWNDCKLLFIGPGAAKCMDVLTSSNFEFDLDTPVSAAGMAKLSFEKYQHGEFEDVAYFEPSYLKDFIAGKPKKLL